MNVRIAVLPDRITWQPRGTAVVIDVLRATTVITQAVASGAASVAVCGEIDEAFRLAEATQPRPLLCGERGCRPIAGFDLGNSPSEYTAERVGGRPLVMTTTNGTRATIAASGFDSILAAAFTNLTAVADRLRGEPEVSILCAGTDGGLTEEDILLAGALLDRLASRGAAPASDEQQAVDAWRQHVASGEPLAARLAKSLGGRNLVAAGYSADIDFCAAIDSTDVIAAIAERTPLTFRRLSTGTPE